MSRRNSSPSVALFPFLAVLVCVMGSLILLLMVTTRRIRQLQIAHEQEMQQELVVPQPEPVLSSPLPSGPTPGELRAAKEADWRRRLEELLALREERKDELDRQRRNLSRVEGELKRAEAGLADLQGRLKSVHGEKGQDAETRGFIEKEDQKVTREISKAQAKIAALKRAHADQQSRFAFIPYDGASGTTRRPIYIECTGEGLRILPEGELLSAKDLAGFTKHYNPVLLGTQSLVQYWTGQLEKKPDQKDTMSVPYVLLLVRPSGCISYYYARELLTHLGQPFGYELIEDDYPLYMPPPDPNAQAVLKQAIQLTYKNRDDVLQTLSGEREVEIEPFDPTGGSGGWGPENYANRNGSGGRDGGNSPIVAGNRGARGGKGYGPTPGSLGDAIGRPGGAGANPNGGGAPGKRGGNGLAANGGKGTGGGWGDGFGPPATGKPGGGGTGKGSGSGTGGTGGNGVAEAPYADLGLGSGDGEGNEDGNAGGDQVAGGMLPRGTGAMRGAPGTPGAPGSLQEGTPGDPLGGTPGGAAADPDAKLTSMLDRNPFDPASNPRFSRTGAASPEGASGDRADEQNQIENPNGTPGAGGSKRNLPRGAKAGSASQNVTGSATTARPADSSSNASDMTGGTSNRALSGRPGNGNRSGSSGPGQSSPLAFNPGGDKRAGDRAARMRWGASEHATVRLQHEVPMQITPTQIIIGNAQDEVVIQVGRGESQEELVELVLNGIDRYSENWGDPPDSFYWVPAVNFRVYPGGNQHYERLHSGLRNWGVYSKVDYVIPEKPVRQRPVRKQSDDK